MSKRWTEVNFETLEGATIVSIHREQVDDNDALRFVANDGTQYRMTHFQDCCENVRIEDIVGNLDDLLNTPILMADEVSQNDNKPEYSESSTWTFYKLATIKGYVTIRWLGESNGYYSEYVSFQRLVVLND